MIRLIDNFLNYFTMYKVVLYGLIILAIISLFLSFIGILAYEPWVLVISISVFIAGCFFGNLFFSKLLRAPANTESYFITALILFFIMSPSANINGIAMFLITSIIAIASKYILAINKIHIFNPAAFAVFFLGFFGRGASWWIANEILLPFVTIIGLLIVRKIRRFNLFFSFLASSLLTIIFFSFLNNVSIEFSVVDAFKSWPLIFFATVMLTEPLTTPPTIKYQRIYGIIVGVLYGSQFQIGPIYSTPEMALLVGNIFSYIVGPKQKLFLSLNEKINEAQNIYTFIFSSAPPVGGKLLNFKPGQYFEWTLPHENTDFRGNRRYFTIASSPTENKIQLGVKIIDKSSSFKRNLAMFKKNDMIVASNLAGDFTLPNDINKKLVFIAGGIGITPFRSMIKYLIDKKEIRSIILFYANKNESEIAYKDIFEKANKAINLKTIYVLTDKNKLSTAFKGKVGRINEKMILEEVPDYKERIFYLSGPNSMVDSYKKLLSKLNIKREDIITDYFPGF